MIRILLRAYQRVASPVLHAVSGGGACRFQPTCSEYAAIAMHTHGVVKGGWFTLSRLLRCHPLARGGFDPVPGTGFDAAPATEAARHDAVT